MRLASFLAGLSLVAVGGCFEDPPPMIDEGGEQTTADTADTDATTGPCDQGALGCACFPNGTCSSGLVCNQGVCDPFDPTTSATTSAPTGTTTGPGDSTTTSVDTGSTGEPETDDGSSSGGPSTHVLFTTADEFSGSDVGGLAGADATCTALGRGLRDGPWVAVLSDATTSLDARVTITDEVVNVHGELLATDEAGFLSGTLMGIPGFDEDGQEIPGQDLAWTGSMTDDCTGWTSDDLEVSGTMGLPSTNDQWLDSLTPLPCSTPIHLYCVSQ